MATTGSTAGSRRRCSHSQAVRPPASPCCRPVDPPHAMTQLLLVPSSHRHVRAFLCTPTPFWPDLVLTATARTWWSSPSPCHLWHCSHVGHPGQWTTCLFDWVHVCDALIVPITSHQGETVLSPPVGPVSLFLSTDRRGATPPNYPAIDHLHSIHRIHGFTITSSHCLAPSSHEEGTAKLQFGAFPHHRPIKAALGHGRGQSSYRPS